MRPICMFEQLVDEKLPGWLALSGPQKLVPSNRPPLSAHVVEPPYTFSTSKSICITSCTVLSRIRSWWSLHVFKTFIPHESFRLNRLDVSKSGPHPFLLVYLTPPVRCHALPQAMVPGIQATSYLSCTLSAPRQQTLLNEYPYVTD